MGWIKKCLILLLLFQLFINIYIHRSLLLSKFDADYWRNKYEQSQWLLLLSSRTIGDDGLYLYEGYKIIHGYDPTLVNAEVPPFSKYLIGLSILIFGNGHWYGAIFTVGSVVVFYFLCRRLLGNSLNALAITALFALDPLLTQQFPLTMIDSAQLFFLLLFFATLTLVSTKKSETRNVYLVFAIGLILGLFSNTRFPILTPLIAFITCVYLWQITHRVKLLVVFLFSVFFTYLLPYARYFMLGHSFTDWLGVQKWIVNFYMSSKLESNIGSIWTTLLANKYQNLFTKSYAGIQEWTIVWPVITALGIVGITKLFFRSQKEKTDQLLWKTIGIFLLILIIFYSIIPFWTRYLLTVLPFLYLGFGLFLNNRQNTRTYLLVCILLVFNFFSSARILFPTPETTFRQFLYDWEHGFFQDMYENASEDTQKQMSRNDFHKKGSTLLRDGQIENIFIRSATPDWYRFVSPQYVSVQITYHTRNLGTFTQDTIVPVVRENDRWHIKWNWSLLLTDLPDDGNIETIVEPARRGSIIRSDKKTRIEDFQSYMIWVTPGLVEPDRETDMLDMLRALFVEKIPNSFIHHRYIFNTDPDIPVPIGVPPKPVNETTKTQLLAYPGISLTPSYGRNNIFFDGRPAEGHVENTQYLECCSRLYSTTTYDGQSGIEKDKNDVLKGFNGGNLVIKDKDGKIIKIIIEAEKRDGANVQL